MSSVKECPEYDVIRGEKNVPSTMEGPEYEVMKGGERKLPSTKQGSEYAVITEGGRKVCVMEAPEYEMMKGGKRRLKCPSYINVGSSGSVAGEIETNGDGTIYETLF